MFIIIVPLDLTPITMIFVFFIYYCILDAKNSVWQMVNAEEIFVKIKSRVGDTAHGWGVNWLMI